MKFELPRAANDTRGPVDFDELVERASDGDNRAIGAIAIALGPPLFDEARAVLKELAGADEVVGDFFVILLERRSPFSRGQGSALEWMQRIVRALAHRRREKAVDDD
jgi:DNA-directed RNA polymerase specialized sigma24 family protein